MKKIDQFHPDKCRDILLDLDISLQVEDIKLEDANKRVLSQDIYARIDVPSFDKSPYDGYAFRGEDTKGASKENPVVFEIIEEIPAGYMPQKTVQKNQAAKILTGGPLPDGANVCYKKEKTKFTESLVYIYEEINPNKDIIPRAEDTKEGKLIGKKGAVLGPGLLGQLASQGFDTIQVYKKPVIGLMATGDELVYPGDDLEDAKIYETNTISLKAIFENIGYEVKIYPISKDDSRSIGQNLNKMLGECDILATTGGASVGDYDYAIDSIQYIGGQVLFWKCAMKPGGSIVVSRLKDKTVLGLSGNPASAILSLYRVCLPYLYKLTGREDIYPKEIQMTLLEDFKRSSPAVRLLRGQMVFEESVVYFRENDQQGNGVLSSFVETDVFLEIPMGTGPVAKGTVLKGYRVGSIFGNLGE